MARKMKTMTLFLGGLTAAAWGCHSFLEEEFWLTLAITFSVAFYHFFMRLLVGSAVNGVLHNRADWHRRWFQPRPWEKGLYERLKVKRWKGRMPTYDGDAFDIRKHTLEEIVQAMCQAEVVHEIIVALSFLPVFTARFLGALPVFLITSLAAAALDLGFVMIQRYNRPRLVRLLEKQKGISVQDHGRTGQE